MTKGFGAPNTAGFAFGRTGYSRVGTPRHPELWTPPKAQRVEPVSEVSRETLRDADVHRAAPRIPWENFLDEYFEWKNVDAEGNPSGQHVALIGPTGQGKTTMLFALYPIHRFTAVFGTKPQDASLTSFERVGFERLDHWKSIDPKHVPRRLIWPQPRKLGEMVPIQRQVFTDAVEHIYAEGWWDVFIDEGYYIDEVLKLSALLRLMYTQIRSTGVSIVLATQRPAWVPVEVYDQSTHLFFWRDTDARNLRRLQEVSVAHSDLIRHIIPNLEQHQVLYLNTRTGVMCRTRSPKIDLPTGR
jgi:hypothetical protein